jgi:hypothetical protein
MIAGSGNSQASAEGWGEGAIVGASGDEGGSSSSRKSELSRIIAEALLTKTVSMRGVPGGDIGSAADRSVASAILARMDALRVRPVPRDPPTHNQSN